MTRRDGANAPMHTPGPWRVGKSFGSVIADHPTGWDDADNLSWYDGHMVCESVKLAENAEFIVRACNSYYDLLAALEDSTLAIAYLMRQLKIVDSGWATVDGRMLSLSSIETANATAIAKAKGGAA